MLTLIKKWLANRWIPLLAAMFAMTLATTSLDVGWQLDDYVHRFLLNTDRAVGGDNPALDIFRFGDGSPEFYHNMLDWGSLPWWTSPTWKVAFWRPLSAATHWIDYQLWPDSAGIMHVHSILWLGLLILVVAQLYRRTEGLGWVAGVATIMYAVDDAHGGAVGWIANRNVLIATLFGVLALIAHIRWRRDGYTTGRFTGPIFFALALLAKESGVAVTAYLFSFALFLDRGSWRGRILSLVPYVLITVGWRAAYVILGYGVSGSELYIDPLSHPLQFAGLAIFRIPILFLGQWIGPPSDLVYLLSSEEITRLMMVGVAALAILSVALISVLRHDKVAKFWALGMILAVIPCVATLPSDRLLFFVGIGAMGLIARFFFRLQHDWSAGTLRLWKKATLGAVASILIFVHLVVPMYMLPVRADQPLGPTERIESFYLPPGDNVDLEGKDVVIVNSPSILHACISPLRNNKNNQYVFRRIRVLATGDSPVSVFRPTERSVLLRPEEGFLAGMLDSLFRSGSEPMSTGDVIEIAGVSIEMVTTTKDGRPLEVLFTFPVSIDDSSLYWLQYTENGYELFIPPVIGENTSTQRIQSLF